MAHYPSCGVGGHCIPVDPYYLIDYAKKNGFHHEFLTLARKINNHMPEFTVEQLIKACNEFGMAVKDKKVAVLGLAYKANIEDCRESPAFEIIKHLHEVAGAEVISYDPYVLSKSTVQTLDEALEGSEVAVIATAHNEFKKLTPEYFISKGIKVIVDGCNCLPKDIFMSSSLVYRGIGR
jgi:nucleotide sugar dehydrogenase